MEAVSLTVRSPIAGVNCGATQSDLPEIGEGLTMELLSELYERKRAWPTRESHDGRSFRKPRIVRFFWF